MTIRQMIALAVALVLAGCGGGGGSGGVPHEDARIGTGSQPPQETVADISARVANVLSRTDSLVASTLYGETSAPAFPTVRLSPSCRGTVCTLTHRPTGVSLRENLADAEVDFSRSEAILSKHGITMLSTPNEYGRSYAAYMNHSGFGVQHFRWNLESGTAWGRYSLAGGDLTRSRPGGSATWTGLMVGVPTGTEGRSNFLQGDAALTYDFAGSSLDASFVGIRNITTNRDHTVTSVRFDGIPVSPDGTFQAGLTGNRIQGGFYGPVQAETVGVFEQRGIVGSFGAKR